MDGPRPAGHARFHRAPQIPAPCKTSILFISGIFQFLCPDHGCLGALRPWKAELQVWGGAAVRVSCVLSHLEKLQSNY